MTGSLLPGSPDSDAAAEASSVAAYAPLAAALGEASAVPEEPGFNPITRVLSAVRRFAWLIALVTVVGSTLGVLATRLFHPEYTAGATIYIESARSANVGPIQAPELFSSYNWVELIRTFSVLDSVVLQMNLHVIPGKGATAPMFDGFALASKFLPGSYILSVDKAGAKYSLKNRAGNVLSTGLVTDSVGREAGFRWVPGPRYLTSDFKAEFTILQPRDAATILQSNLKVGLAGDKSSFLQMSLSGIDPNRIAATVNAVQRRFVAVAADIKKKQLRELSQLLGDQVTQQETKLRLAEQSLETFRVSTITQPREDSPMPLGLVVTQGSAYSRYFQQRVEIETLQNERRSIEDVLQRASEGGVNTIDAFQTIAAVQRAPDLSKVLLELSAAESQLRALRSRYTDEYKGVKDLQDQIATLRQVTIPTYAADLVRQMKIHEADLEGRVNSSGQELKGIPIRTITEGRLQREMESAKVLFLNLQNRYEEAKLAEISAIPDVRVMDEAVAPTRPSKNQASKIILLGFVASLGAGVGLAILLDRLDKRFRYPEQASHELGLNILGAVPKLPRPNGRRAAAPEEMSQVVEAFRSIRLNLAHSFEPGKPICITVSSPSPGDGKSLIVCNLALSFAEAGYRTILVDGDTRRGNLHRTFAAERRPGLLDYLGAPSMSVEQTYRATSHHNLTLIPCGVRLQHGPELLGSARMAQLVSRLKNDFEVVLIDSPPLGAGIDPFVLATHSTNIMIVLRSGETDRRMAEAKLRILDRLPVRTLGAVLNHISAGAGAYKYYSYSYGYAAEDEAMEELGDGTMPEGIKAKSKV